MLVPQYWQAEVWGGLEMSFDDEGNCYNNRFGICRLQWEEESLFCATCEETLVKPLGL